MNPATVYLVGAGPGDPGLITVRARELLARADAVIYDFLASCDLLALAPADAERVYVGKKGFAPHLDQASINELLVEKACEIGNKGGSCIVRLKGGDPFLFGRGGEEALALAKAGIPFEVVPGVTSGIAATAYAGIPVTHRGVASTVTFVTGHEDPEKNASAVDWKALAGLADAGGTLCFYMGMRNIRIIASRLRDCGLAADFPVALVQRGTTPAQRTLVTTLDDAADDAEAAGFGAPAIILVGRVASLRSDIAWFENRPLSGLRVVVTRARGQANSLIGRLEELGAEVIAFPVLAFTEPDDASQLDTALSHIERYDWIVFTSVNGVEAFFTHLDGDARLLAHARIAVIGPATARALELHGIKADVIPDEYRGEAVFEAMKAASVDDGGLAAAKVLVARAQEARETLPNLLQEAGCEVDVVASYKTVVPDDADVESLVLMLEEGKIDGVTFTSPSTVKNLKALLGDGARLLERVTAYSIGPVTSAELERNGIEHIVQAGEYTEDGLISAIIENRMADERENR